jgi:hypothetical protein
LARCLVGVGIIGSIGKEYYHFNSVLQVGDLLFLYS